jgi:hypothetical protein
MALFFYDPAGIVPGNIEQRDPLIITPLLSGVFAISDEKHSTLSIKIAPFDPRDLVLPHRRRHSETYDTSYRNLLPLVCLERRDNPIELVLSRSAVAFIALPDKTQTPERNPSEIDRLSRHDHAVNGGGVGQDRLQVSKINADRDRASALKCALLTKFDEPLAVKVAKPEMPESLIKEPETCSLGPSDSLANFFEIMAVKCYEFAEEFGVTGSTRCRRLLSVDLPLNVERPFLGILSAEECLVDIFPLSSDLGSPGTRF